MAAASTDDPDDEPPQYEQDGHARLAQRAITDVLLAWPSGTMMCAAAQAVSGSGLLDGLS
jgi:hypothetical protein